MAKLDLMNEINISNNLLELHEKGILPEPYDDGGYYLVYYSEKDYRIALPDIVGYFESGMRIYYDRYQETGSSHVNDFISKSLSSHCRLVVFYLSENVFEDPTFKLLCKSVYDNNLPCISINSSDKSGSHMIKEVSSDEELIKYVNKLFPNEITYIPSSLPLKEKKRELSKVYENHTMSFKIHGDFAVAEYVKDLSEIEVIIPKNVEIQGVTYEVKGVSSYAFSGCEELKRIVFPDTIEEIGYGCDDPSDTGVFENCSSLEEIVFPNKNKYIYGGMFKGCSSLKRLIFNDDAIFVGDKDTHFEFRSDRNTDMQYYESDEEDVNPIKVTNHRFEEIRLPKACKINLQEENCVRFSYSSSNVFFDKVLISEKISGGDIIKVNKDHYVNSVSEVYMFPKNKEVEKVTFDKEFYLGERWINIFYECDNLKEVILPETIVVLESTFKGCKNLKQINLPDCLCGIEGMNFAWCTSLKEVKFPKYLYNVDEFAFYHSGVETIISDSIYSAEIFKKGYKHPADAFVFESALMRGFMKMVLKASSRRYAKDDFKRKPFYWMSNIKTIYINENVDKFKIEDFVEVESDKIGYRKYKSQIIDIAKSKYALERLEQIRGK